MPLKARQSFQQSRNYVPSEMKRRIFRAVDTHTQSHDYIRKAKNDHFRHKSQPIEQLSIRDSQIQQTVQSFQETLRKARVKASHLRLASQTSDHWNRPSKKPKPLCFQYNKWYINPALRLKIPIQNKQSSAKRYVHTDLQTIRSSLATLRESILGETQSKINPFNEHEDQSILFVKEFAERQPKNLSLLKEFKKKQMGKKCRTPQLVDMILEADIERKENKPIKGSSTKLSELGLESITCSKTVSKFCIEESDCIRMSQSHKPTAFMRPRKRMTLLESEYAMIKHNVSKEVEESRMFEENLKIERFRMKI